MSDELYHADVLVWSERQAERLRRVAHGERVNDVDWEHVIEEIEDVGLSELNAVRSHLRLMLVHLLKLHGWPQSPAREHWRGEIRNFQAEALQRYTPSMRERIALPELYRIACRQLSGMRYDGMDPTAFPAQCPLSLDDLLMADPAGLESGFSA